MTTDQRRFVPLDPYTREPWDPHAAAAEGAALLDRLPWLGWREQVSVDQLDMGDGQFAGDPDCKACVGAQLTYRLTDPDADWGGIVPGSYTEFVPRVLPWLYEPDAPLRASLEFTVHYGFRTPLDDEWGDPDGDYERLTDAWREILTGA
jgi:hypothetical protein